MHTLAKSVDQDKITYTAVFNQGLHYLVKQKNYLQRKKYNFCLATLICNSRYIQSTIICILYQIRRTNTVMHKGKTVHTHIPSRGRGQNIGLGICLLLYFMYTSSGSRSPVCRYQTLIC